MGMTAKHYEIVADRFAWSIFYNYEKRDLHEASTLKWHAANLAIDELTLTADSMANDFAAENPRFKRDKFMARIDAQVARKQEIQAAWDKITDMRKYIATDYAAIESLQAKGLPHESTSRVVALREQELVFALAAVEQLENKPLFG